MINSKKLLSILDTGRRARKVASSPSGELTYTMWGPADHISIRNVCFMYIPDIQHGWYWDLPDWSWEMPRSL
jgi:hypothetical protein